jgi:hypothetical protein
LEKQFFSLRMSDNGIVDAPAFFTLRATLTARWELMTARGKLAEQAIGLARRAACEVRRHWRFLVGAGLALAAVAVAIDRSDVQGRYDISAGYAVRMTCESDPESILWSGGCDRVAADIARTDKPNFIELYRAFVAAHHRHIPSPATRRRFAQAPCDPAFERDAALKGTRFVLEPVRVRFLEACMAEHVEAIKAELDERDRALMTIEREALSHEALLAGTLANLTEPLVIFAGAVVLAALLIL